MARLEFDGIDSILLQMQKGDAGLPARIEKALELSAAVMAEQMKQETRSFKQPTGELASKVRPGKVMQYMDGVSIDVWAQGTYKGRRGSSRRAATVGFVLEYGRSDMEPNPWHKRSSEAAIPRVNSIMMEVLG